ncbi:MAG: DUF5752 family protein [Acidobacteriia bacterium]|jgi:hypothetical protein|nr:DUF5752 family protein [Terriglobia bacterium]
MQEHAATSSARSRRATEPFQFVAASYLIRIGRQRATNLGELARHLRTCPDASIFYHTFQSLESHHYTTFSSDFAQWVMAACNEPALAERMAALDLREFVSIADLRRSLVQAVEDHLRSFPPAADRPAFEPFHFCEAVEVVFPVELRAFTLAELASGIRRLSLHTLHYHLINSRLRLQLKTNDFSFWVEHSLGLPELAERINRVDFYTNTLEGVREEVVRLLESWDSP